MTTHQEGPAETQGPPGLRVAFWVGGIALTLWLITLAVALAFAWYYHSTEVPGQIGDTFGVFNALASSFTLTGLIYTVLLQRHETHAQNEANRDDREDRAWRQRQELLTARLAARTAVLQAHEQARLASLGPMEPMAEFHLEEIRLQRIQIALLEIEARGTFEPRPWTDEVERQCLGVYIEEMVRNSLKSCSVRAKTASATAFAQALWLHLMEELTTLEVFSDRRHPGLVAVVGRLMDRLEREDVIDAEVERMAEYRLGEKRDPFCAAKLCEALSACLGDLGAAPPSRPGDPPPDRPRGRPA